MFCLRPGVQGASARQDVGFPPCAVRRQKGETVRQRIARWVLVSLLSGERTWAAITILLALAAVSLAPMVLVGWLSSTVAFLVSWPIAVACALAAHIYRGRAMLWEALCRKAQREGSEFVESFLKGQPRVVEVVIRADGAERMPN